MDRTDLRRRQRVVTEEPFVIAADLKGCELASVRRRAVAIGLDVFLLTVLGTPVLFAAMLLALYVQNPPLARAMTGLVGGAGGGDLDAVRRSLAETPIDILAQLGSSGVTAFDTRENLLTLRGDVIFGRLSSVFSFAALALTYFTRFAWLGRGRTPGKWLTGIRVARLDGRRLRLWDAFGRAGGYAASLSTAGLGFFEALWDPNRQTLHDRVASTVVIRAPRGVEPAR